MERHSNLTISLPPDVDHGLEAPADAAHRSNAELAAEAIARFVSHEAAVIEGIQRGLADMRADRLVSHAEAMERLESTISSSWYHRD